MPRGKRVTITPEKLRTICEAIEAGNTRECAAAAVGLSRDWLYDQIAKSPSFRQAVEAADAKAEQHHVRVVQKAASKGNWTASAWWLERRRQPAWGRVDKAQVDQTVNVSGGLTVVYAPQVAVMPPTEPTDGSADA